MLFFALFTVGYFFGVFTVLLIFPPQVKEIEEQERDALKPISQLTNESINHSPVVNEIPDLLIN